MKIQNKLDSSSSSTSRFARSAGKALFCAQALLIALSGCSNSSDGGGDGGSGNATSGGSSGESSQGGNDSGGQSVGGSSGSNTGGEVSGGSGGETGGSGGGDTGGTGGSGDGGSGGTDTGVAIPCAPTTGDNAAGLGVKRAEISTRKIGNAAVANVMRIERDPSTGDIIYMNQGGQFWKLDLATGASTSVDLGFGGGNNCRSMKFASDGTLYVQCHGGGGISVVIKKGVPNGAGGRTWTTLVSSDGYQAGNTNFDHSFNGIAVSPDDQYVYFGSGSRTDHGEIEQGIREVPLTSAIFRVPANSTDLQLQNDATALQPYLFADGTRNAFDLAFNAVGDLIAIDNGPDIDFPDELNWIQEGKHYGFPWRFGDQDNPNMDPNYTAAGDQRLHGELQAVQLGTYKYEADFPAAPQGVSFIDPIKNLGPDNDKFCIGKACQVMDASDTSTEFHGLTGHRSPLGLNFDTEGKLCGDYYKAGFVTSYGPVVSIFGEGEGQDVSMVQLTKVGDAYEMHVTQLVTDMIAPIDSVLVDNKLYVIEYRPGGGGGNIYEITFPLPAN